MYLFVSCAFCSLPTTQPRGSMQNDDIVQAFQDTADLLELTGGNPHRARAFSRAARAIDGLEASAAERLQAGTLVEVSGIGSGMAEHVAELVQGGSLALRDELMGAVPPGLMDVMKVQGLGTKRTRRLWTELGITSLDELEQAAERDEITALSGFGTKTQQNILDNLRQLRRYESQWRLDDAWTATHTLLEALRPLPAVSRAEPTGALRRRCETLSRAEVLVATDAPNAVRDWLEDRLAEATLEDGAVTGRGTEGVPFRIHFTPSSHFGTAWWRTTGTEEHCAAVSDHGEVPTACAEEASLYDRLDLAHVPPALRETGEAVAAAARHALPTLITTDDLHGCLHNHSTYSDGSHSLREMAEAARARGYSYFGICDHSQSLQIANGLSPDSVRTQRDEVDRLNEELTTGTSPIRIFHGIESDILRDGSLDYEDALLKRFDFIVASVHSGFSMHENEATKRLVRAIENPFTRILGHPTGRLLLRRDGYPIDHATIIEACAENDVALEVNANPNRLDLDWRWIRQAAEAGVLLSINPDAHSTQQIANTRWGVAVGRKGWLTPQQCLNAKPLPDFVEWLD